jgi:hypothetical protein
LPGGQSNPVAVISIPRERMIGSGIASSLVHEVGHQGAALLRLVPSLRAALHDRQRKDPERAPAWRWLEKWISEIMAEFWSVARVGVGSTLGLMAVLSLPRPFVFRLDPDDPHPIPWLRVKASCAFGDHLYPHPQWRRLARLWEALYPASGIDPAVLDVIDGCERVLGELAGVIASHRPVALRGARVGDVLGSDLLRPERLQAQLMTWRARPALVETAGPCHVFAVIGQARADGKLSPEGEARALSRLLTLRSSKPPATRYHSTCRSPSWPTPGTRGPRISPARSSGSSRSAATWSSGSPPRPRHRSSARQRIQPRTSAGMSSRRSCRAGS